ncbi:MAG: hypothetical protein OXC02_01515 [Rhodobacteraceae bacterium]|nr:hypothetical protein [Paracoccaceae bacterium]
MSDKTPPDMVIAVQEDLHDYLQTLAEEYGQTVTEYLHSAIQERIEWDIEDDKIWGELAVEAKKNGMLSVEESEKFFERIRSA